MSDTGETPQCDSGNDYNGEMGVRISAVFVILVGSLLGAWFPVYARRHKGVVTVPSWAFFLAKYFGSGVIIATAFIHLLAPAVDALTDECLTGPITQYDWAEGIALMTVFVMFFLELMTMRYANFGGEHDHHSHGSDGSPARLESDHFGHHEHHVDNNDVPKNWEQGKDAEATAGNSVVPAYTPETYSVQLTSIFILEFGVIFHSIFVGLTLAVQGEGFHILYVVIVFHQTFEGLGLGSRLASVPWNRKHSWTPYILALAYGLTTPLAIAVGLGVRKSYPPGSQTTLIVNGVFDAISAGILLYTGLIELMAHEFMFSNEMRRAPLKLVLSAFFTMCFGAGLMALLGKWA